IDFTSTPPPTIPLPTLLPYTTLFRSGRPGLQPAGRAGRPAGRPRPAGGPQRYCPGGAVLLLRDDQRGIRPVRHRELPAGEVYLRSEEHTSELQSRFALVCRLLLA